MTVETAEPNAFEKGEDAWRAGEPITANPFFVNTRPHKHWVWGWNKARDCATQDSD